MINHLQINVPSCVRRKLLAGLVGSSVLTLTALAQDPATPTRLKPTVITGSLIPTAETVGAAPVETIGAVDIEKVGATDVLDLVRRVSPVFSGNFNTGQEVNNGGFGESYLAIRNLPTLVLLNGRRLGNSAFSDGALVDVNTIPLSAIDRVEVLKDGSSALYGSQAVGGVVNIITKQNYSGLEIGGRYGFATGEGSFTERRATLAGGTAIDNASFSAALQWYERDGLKSTDRSTAGLSAAELEANNINPAGVSYLSPSFPGKVSDTTGAYVLRSHPLLQEFSPGDYDPTAPLSPPRIPDGMGGFKSFGGPTAVQDYINDPFWAANGTQAPYIADPGLILNTPLFGTQTIQAQDRRNFYANGHYDLFGKEVSLFADFLYADIRSLGALAPSPVVGLGSKQANLNIPAGNIYNPFQIDLGPDAGPDGLPPGGPRVRSRFVDSGNRIFDSESAFYHFTGGLRGDLANDYSYEAVYNYNKYNQLQSTHNAINGAALENALLPNVNPALAAQGLSRLLGEGSVPVPMFNIFGVPSGNIYSGPLVNDPATINAIKTSLFERGVSEAWDATAQINGTPFELPAGKLAFAVGGGFTSESLSVNFDGLTRSGQVPGLNAASPTGGTRDSWAGFAEVRIPITSPDMDIPAVHALELTVAGRYETYEPGGDAAVPKVSLRWQPFDEQLTIRGSYAESFIAPTTFQLFGGDQASVPVLVVPPTSAGGEAVLQEYTVWQSNEDLTPEDATSWTVGFVYSPKFVPGLTLSVDYYHVKTEDSIFRIDEQSMVDAINTGTNTTFNQYFFNASGNNPTPGLPNQANDQDWGTLLVPLANGAEIETDGIDILANYGLPTDGFGRFDFYANANILFNFEYSDPIAGGPYQYRGKYSDPNTIAPGGQGTLPDFQINTGVTWDIMDFTFNVNARYIPETEAWGSEQFTINEQDWFVEDWYSIDLQLAYNFRDRYPSWLQGVRVAVGVNNVTDNSPPLIASAFEDNTDKSTYDIIGRFIYFEVSKRF
jgi:iron complex outermembrane recepter protein